MIECIGLSVTLAGLSHTKPTPAGQTVLQEGVTQRTGTILITLNAGCALKPNVCFSPLVFCVKVIRALERPPRRASTSTPSTIATTKPLTQ